MDTKQILELWNKEHPCLTFDKIETLSACLTMLFRVYYLQHEDMQDAYNAFNDNTLPKDFISNYFCYEMGDGDDWSIVTRDTTNEEFEEVLQVFGVKNNNALIASITNMVHDTICNAGCDAKSAYHSVMMDYELPFGANIYDYISIHIPNKKPCIKYCMDI